MIHIVKKGELLQIANYTIHLFIRISDAKPNKKS